MGHKDIVSKAILKRIVVDLARYLLNMRIEAIEILDSESQRIEQRRADLVVLARRAAGEFLLHFEIQNDNEVLIPARMLRYLSDLALAYPRYQIEQCLIYIGKRPLRMTDSMHHPGLDYHYRLIDMQQVDCDLFLQRSDPDALVLAILCDFKGRDDRAVVREILQRLRAATREQPGRFGEYLQMLEVLSTNRDLKDCIQEEEKMMNVAIEDLPSYQLVVDKVMEKGIEKGIEKGMEKGAEQNARTMFLRLFEARFGGPDGQVLARVEAASAAQMMDWSEALLAATPPDEVFE